MKFGQQEANVSMLRAASVVEHFNHTFDSWMGPDTNSRGPVFNAFIFIAVRQIVGICVFSTMVTIHSCAFFPFRKRLLESHLIGPYPTEPTFLTAFKSNLSGKAIVPKEQRDMNLFLG